MEFSHIPVLLPECLEGLRIRPDGTYLDGTAGGGGHSAEIARRLTTGRLIALDKDPAAVKAAGERLRGLPSLSSSLFQLYSLRISSPTFSAGCSAASFLIARK